MLLKIVLGCLIAIILAVGFIVFAIWYHIRQALRDACNDNTNPLTIHLNEDLAPEWLDSKDTRKLITEFRDLGFTPGTPYIVPEMSGMSILSLFHDKYLGVVYDLPQTGKFFDLLHRCLLYTSPSPRDS